MKTPIPVAAYLVDCPAISPAAGADVAIVNAFLFIALDLTRCAAQRVAGGGNSADRHRLAAGLRDRSAGPIALASFVLGRRRRLIPSCTTPWDYLGALNGLNVVSAAADSPIFPVLALGCRCCDCTRPVCRKGRGRGAVGVGAGAAGGAR